VLVIYSKPPLSLEGQADSLNVERWMQHHDARNRSPHTYDPEVAESVLLAAHVFVADAQHLLEALEARND
jgi:hypothetical protein